VAPETEAVFYRQPTAAMEFESPATLLEPKTEIDLDLSLDDLDAILEFDVVSTVPPLINPVRP
jgi:hypothetical protein